MDLRTIVEQMRERGAQNMDTLRVNCPACNDTGWVEVDPITRAVRRCECYEAKAAEERIRNSGLSESLDRMTFDTFATRTDIQRQIKQTAQTYLTDLLAADRRKPWLYIGGNPGSGKTHICTAVCGELLKRKIPVRYMQWLEAARELKAAVNDEDFPEMVYDYINVRVLYIDDLLKQKYTRSPQFTEADIKVAFTILNARYIQDKPTTVSSTENSASRSQERRVGKESRSRWSPYH